MTTLLTGTVETPTKPSDTDETFKSFLDKLKPGDTQGQEPELPKMFSVILHNNDDTPHLTVIRILIEVFEKTPAQAAEITYAIHRAGPAGKAVAGVYPKDVAETKVRNAKVIEREDVRTILCMNRPLTLQLTLEEAA